MVRFWPTAGIACLLAGFLALVAMGLWSAAHGIVDVQGQWFGATPLDGGDQCRIRILPTDDFDLECKGQTKYLAKGTWTRDGNRLEMKFSLFVRDGKRVSSMPPPWVFRVDGARNTLFLGLPEERGEPWQWRRASP